MAVYVRGLHHISLHVSNVERTVRELVRFRFRPLAARRTAGARQLALRGGDAVFVVNERSDVTAASCLYDAQPRHPVDSACNVCFQVEDVPRAAELLSARGCHLLVPPTRVQDAGGPVTYAVVRSVVENVWHTLLDASRYCGPFLPGFHKVALEGNPTAVRCPITHFDHITYACPRGSSHDVIRWYQHNFGFQRVFIGSNEDAHEGFVLNQDGIGLRLTAMENQKGSETGLRLPLKDPKERDCKFVIAESLPNQGRNQVDRFLEQHHGPGIQHIGLFTQDIVSTAETMTDAGVQFFSPPAAYYTEVGKRREIEEAGHDPEVLKKHGILLDTDLREGPNALSERYLLQVFTKPIFSEDTFFLELIERRGATGFGEGNIRALWKSVQSCMDEDDPTETGKPSESNMGNIKE